MYGVVYQLRERPPRIMSIHKTESAAQENAAWLALTGSIQPIAKNTHYYVDIELPWNAKEDCYQRFGERIWIIEVERKNYI